MKREFLIFAAALATTAGAATALSAPSAVLTDPLHARAIGDVERVAAAALRKPAPTPSSLCRRLVGVWTIQHLGGDVIVRRDGTAMEKDTGATATLECGEGVVTFHWRYGFYGDQAFDVSANGDLLTQTNGVIRERFARKSAAVERGGTGPAGPTAPDAPEGLTLFGVLPLPVFPPL